MRRPPWWLLALLVLMAFAFQGTRGLWETDEGRYAAAAVNMLESGDWLVPTLDGDRPHLTKPPITYWAIAASVGAFGHDEWAVRLPGALAFIGTGLLVFGLGRRLCPAKPWLPAVVWALSPAPLVAANIASTDVVLTFFETAAAYAFVEAWLRDGAGRRRWVFALWLCCALAFMTKGPPGLLPLAALIAFLARHDRARLRGLFPPLGLLAFAVVAFTWFAILVYQQPDRLGYFVGYEVRDRLLTARHGRNPEWYGGIKVYLPMLVLGALPWWPMALAAAGGPRAAWRRARAAGRTGDPGTLLLLYWFLLPLAVFMLARSRLELYILPLFVPLALLLARPLAKWAWLEPRRLAITAAIAAVSLLGLKATAAHVSVDRDTRRMAADIRRAVDLRGVDEIVFVDMRAFCGLRFYLGIQVESVRLGGPGHPEARPLPTTQDLCAELAEGENALYGMRRSRIPELAPQVAACRGFEVQEAGVFDGGGREVVLFRIRPAPRAPRG